MTGYHVMAVREARRCRLALQRGQLWAAIDGMCCAFRFMGYAESALPLTSPARSISRAWMAIDAVRVELAWETRRQTVIQSADRHASVG